MRKSLFAIGLLAVSYSVQAQNVLCHVDTNANMYVSEGTLVYSGGGVQTKGSGLLDVHGNVMIVGAAGDALKTITNGGLDKTDGGNIVLRLNNSGSYDTSTYGQLYINGLNQGDITGIVSKEFRSKKHGSGNFYQQLAMPFFGKTLSSLSAEFGKVFDTQRYSKNEILKLNNTNNVAETITSLATTTSDPSGYYMLGSNNNNLDTSTPPASMPTIAPTTTGSVYTINGRPNATLATATLQNGGSVDFGAGGNNLNPYGEKYNTHVQDQFEFSTGAWVSSTYGKNFYQFGNPFLTNLDLSRIGYIENGGVTDGNNITNIWGVRYDPGTVVVTSAGNAYSMGAQIQTYNPVTGVPAGDVGLIIKPMQAFVLKLRNNNPQTLNFNTLRRFNSTTRAAGTDYNVTAAKNGTTAGTMKQLGVIGLDAGGNEVSRAYYVVSNTATTGFQSSIATTVQATNTSSNLIGTFEELPNGGYDPNYNAKYWLYINEANENNFLGKDILLWNYDYDKPSRKIVSYKFEIREDAELVPAGTHQLSSGIGFYYKASNGTVQQAKQGDIVSLTSKSYNLYYGEPNRGSLGTKDTESTQSRTMVVYNPDITNYIVRFDPDWKKADIEVYDMSGKLVISKKAVDTSRDFVIELNSALKNSYVVKIVSEKGITVSTKILK